MKKKFKLVAMMLAIGIALSACGGAKGGTADNGKSADGKGGEPKFTVDAGVLPVKNEGKAIKGGTLQVALVTDSPFKGLFSEQLYQDAYDSYLMQYTMIPNLYNLDESFRIVSSKYLDIKYDEKAKTVTYKINDKLKWNDGKPVTSKDFEYSYYVVGNKDYTGVRYGQPDQLIEGMEEYHAGKTDKISGITTPDKQTIVVKFKEFAPAIQWGSGQQTKPVPYEYLKDIPIKDLEKSDKIRQKPLAYGPFYLSNLVQGQKAEFSPNKYWAGDKPKLDKVVFEVVPSSNVISSMKAHKYDTYTSIPPNALKDAKEIAGYASANKLEFYYSYLGFRLGKYDKTKNEVVVNKDAKLKDVNVRKAMGHALDLNAIGKKFYNGDAFQAKSVILPVFKDFYNDKMQGYDYDLEKAKKLLDEAGYKDKNNDGLREDPNGKPFKINFMMMSGSEVSEPLSQYYLQQWKEIGLDVQLYTGRLIEFNSFYDKLQNDDPNVDMFAAAWGVGTNPSPEESYGAKSSFNQARYTSEKIQKAINDITSVKANDPKFMNNAYKEFQQAIYDEAPVIPLMWRNDYTFVNKRVLNFNAGYGNGAKDLPGWEAIEVSSDKPITK